MANRLNGSVGELLFNREVKLSCVGERPSVALLREGIEDGGKGRERNWGRIVSPDPLPFCQNWLRRACRPALPKKPR